MHLSKRRFCFEVKLDRGARADDEFTMVLKSSGRAEDKSSISRPKSALQGNRGSEEGRKRMKIMATRLMECFDYREKT